LGGNPSASIIDNHLISRYTSIAPYFALLHYISRRYISMRATTLTVTESSSVLAFPLGDGTNRPWWRYLTLNDTQLYFLGNVCETCELLFSRIHSAPLPLAPAALRAQLQSGLRALDQPLLDTIAPILPTGSYHVSLLALQPKAIRCRATAEPRMPPFTYYQTSDQRIDRQRTLHELILPIMSETTLDAATVKEYRKQFRAGYQPTAIALSMVDVRYPSGRGFEWNLIHFLLDGHHKMRAASQQRRFITVLSFLSIDQSLARETMLNETISLKYT
jgi:hypothetical protein